MQMYEYAKQIIPVLGHQQAEYEHNYLLKIITESRNMLSNKDSSNFFEDQVKQQNFTCIPCNNIHYHADEKYLW